MSPRELQALLGFDGTDEDFGFMSFKQIAQSSELDIRHVRRTVRSLARKGFLKYGRGLWSEDGEPRGSGYAITREGIEYLARQP